MPRSRLIDGQSGFLSFPFPSWLIDQARGEEKKSSTRKAKGTVIWPWADTPCHPARPWAHRCTTGQREPSPGPSRRGCRSLAKRFCLCEQVSTVAESTLQIPITSIRRSIKSIYHGEESRGKAYRIRRTWLSYTCCRYGNVFFFFSRVY